MDLPEPIDGAVFDEMLGSIGADEPGLVLEIVGAFLDQASSALLTLRDAGQAGDAPTIRATAHGLKSSCAHLGAREMASLCHSMEVRARAGELDGYEALLLDLRREHGRVEAALREKLAILQ